MRLNRYLAAAGAASRREADKLIAAGQVKVNGERGVLGQDVTETDAVELYGKRVQLPSLYRYLALNKPPGYVSSRRRQGSDPIVYDLLPPEWRNLRLVGRLDRDSSGLLLLSDDGDFIQQYSHPSADKTKLYEVDVDRDPKPADLHQLGEGVTLEDGPSRLVVRSADGRKLVLELAEGRNRQIRRTLGALGYGITRLHRTAVGPYQLGSLAEGAWQEIKP